MKASILKNCENMFGKITPQIQKRIKTYINNPTFDNWDDIKGIIINNSYITIWQAVLEIDSSFPRRGRSTDEKGKIITEWERIPAPLQILQAIKRVIN